MNYTRALNQYKHTDIQTANKSGLVLLCYEKAIENFLIARNCLAQKEHVKKTKAIQKGLAIVNELQCCLDFEKGGQIARNLDSIYNYIHRRLLEGDARNDGNALDEAIRLLKELHAAWEAVIHQQNATPPANAMPSHGAKDLIAGTAI